MTTVVPADTDQTRAAIRSTYDLGRPIYYRLSKAGFPSITNGQNSFDLGRAASVPQSRAPTAATSLPQKRGASHS